MTNGLVLILLCGYAGFTFSMESQLLPLIVDLDAKEKTTYRIKDANAYDKRPVLTESNLGHIVLKIKQITNNKREEKISIKAHKNELRIYLAAESTVQLPLLQAKRIDIDIADSSKVTMQDKALLTADFISIVKKGNADVFLAIQTKLLQVTNDGGGTLTIKGKADEQKLDLAQGSFLAFDLKSKIIRAIIRNAHGEIELFADELIKGILSLKTKHNVTFNIDSDDAIQLQGLEDILKKYAHLTQYSKDDILRCYGWEVC